MRGAINRQWAEQLEEQRERGALWYGRELECPKSVSCMYVNPVHASTGRVASRAAVNAATASWDMLPSWALLSLWNALLTAAATHVSNTPEKALAGISDQHSADRPPHASGPHTHSGTRSHTGMSMQVCASQRTECTSHVLLLCLGPCGCLSPICRT